MNQITSPGYFGKLPQRGDFVSRRLPRDFVDKWDGWLQESIACSRDQLADSWLEIYLTSPIWRFILCEGICGELPRAGVLMPSVDKVGRYYPLTLATSLPLKINPFQVAITADKWFDDAEEIILGALDDEALNLDSFDDKVENLVSSPLIGEGRISPKNNMSTGSAWHLPLPSVENLQLIYSELLQNLITQQFSRYTLWWTAGSERVGPALLIAKHMPPVEGFAAFLDGNWNQWGWDSWNAMPAEPESNIRVNSASGLK